MENSENQTLNKSSDEYKALQKTLPQHKKNSLLKVNQQSGTKSKRKKNIKSLKYFVGAL